MRRWTAVEIEYMGDHANEGAEAIAEALGRSVSAVQSQAFNQGISLRKWDLCPRCGRKTFQPLVRSTGWCRNCTREVKRARLEEQVRDMEAEDRRTAEEKRKRQAIYSRKARLKKR